MFYMSGEDVSTTVKADGWFQGDAVSIGVAPERHEQRSGYR
jgi:hypothetical protein